MAYGMTGTQPIEYYYPGGFGEFKIVEQDETRRPFVPGIFEQFQWVSPAILNRTYYDTSPKRPIYENQWLSHPSYPNRACSTSVRLRAVYSRYIGQPPIVGGLIKYAVIDGIFPSGLTLDIDRGIIFGVIEDLDLVFAEEFGITDSDNVVESGNDKEAFENFGFLYDNRSPSRVSENNYAAKGSAAMYAGGFPVSKDVTFTARAFDSGNTSNYIDGVFTISTDNNWSADRDAFILNIKNQMYVDGKPVTNSEYLQTMKARGFFPNC